MKFIKNPIKSLSLALSGSLIVFLPVLSVFAYISANTSYVATESRQIQFVGNGAGEQFGASIATGDVNGDKLDDLIVGSPFYSYDQAVWMGKVSVYFGEENVAEDSGLSSDVDVVESVASTPDLVFYGKAAGDQLGISVDSGDFNNDGFDDLLMGAYNASSNEERKGRAYLVLGKEYFPRKDFAFSNYNADFQFIGKNAGDYFGLSVHLEDMDGDNFDDVFVGAPFALSIDGVKTGVVYGYQGKPYRTNRVYSGNKFFNERDADLVFWGESPGERFGANIEIVDVVGDSYKDIAISAYFADGPNGSQSGKVYLYKGSANMPVNAYDPYDVLVGAKSYGWFGFDMEGIEGKVLDSGEIEKDDLIVSSFPYASEDGVGEIFWIHGREWFVNPFDENQSEFVVDQASSDKYFKGMSGDNMAGASFGAGDFDGDGLTDLFVGAPGVALTETPEEGEVYLFYDEILGEMNDFDLDLYSASTFVFGENPDDWFGARGAVLDFNGDGYDDIAVSSRYYDLYDPETGLVAETNVGKVYVLLGAPENFGDEAIFRQATDDYITRGDFIKNVIERFDINNTRKSYIDSCYSYREFCFYIFTSQSTFDGITLEPELVLYPDILPDSEYYESVNLGTMLGVISGFPGEEGNPFGPEKFITRIQALKVVLAINQLVAPIYKFELINKLGSVDLVENQVSAYDDINPKIGHMWWYVRFANFAKDNLLLGEEARFRPDDYITKGEFNELLVNTLQFINTPNEEEVASN